MGPKKDEATGEATLLQTFLDRIDLMERRHREDQERLREEHRVTINDLMAGRGDHHEQGGGGRQRQVLRPPGSNVKLLSGEPTMTEFKEWQKGWDDYANLNRAVDFPRDIQVSAVRQYFFSPAFTTTFDTAVTVTAATRDAPTVAEIVASIQTYVRGKKNVMVDRYEFYRRRQEEGESFESFYVDLKRRAGEAEICATCKDSTIATMIAVGVDDPELATKLLALRPAPDLDTVLTTCRSHEAAIKDQKSTAKMKSANLAKGNQNHRSSSESPDRGRGRSENRNKGANSKSTPEKCGQCGRKAHNLGETCRAKGKKCDKCGNENHFAIMCRTKGKAGTARISNSRIRVVNARWDRSVAVKVEDKEFVAEPDTGADISIMPEKMWKEMGEPKLLKSDINIEGFDGREVTPKGYFRADISVQQSDNKHVEKIYVEGGAKNFLLSGPASEELGIIKFPYHQALVNKADGRTKHDLSG